LNLLNPLNPFQVRTCRRTRRQRGGRPATPARRSSASSIPPSPRGSLLRGIDSESEEEEEGIRRVQLVRRDGRDVSTLYGRERGIGGIRGFGACSPEMSAVCCSGGGVKTITPSWKKFIWYLRSKAGAQRPARTAQDARADCPASRLGKLRVGRAAHLVQSTPAWRHGGSCTACGRSEESQQDRNSKTELAMPWMLMGLGIMPCERVRAPSTFISQRSTFISQRSKMVRRWSEGGATRTAPGGPGAPARAAAARGRRQGQTWRPWA
jgi:hypothetical protein